MDSILGRYRNLVILVGVLFLQVLGLAVQVKKGSDMENTRLIRIWAVGVVTPLERVVVWAQNGVGGIWHNYFYLRGVRAENRELKEQIEQMRIEQVRLNEDAAQARRLQTLLAFKEQFISKTVAAQVIGSGGSDLSRVIYIDKGADAGLQRDMAVITADGVVGKVTLVYPSVAQVLLVNDPSSGVGVILEKSRLQGVLRGTSNGEVVLNDVMSDEQVPVGEAVLTSGGDQIFPKGLPVGAVAKVGNGKDLFLSIKVKTAANLSKLEEVLVLVEKQERESLADDKNKVRAADILAQRLPSVPDKPANGAGDNNAATSAAAAAGTAKTSATQAGAKPAGAAGAPQQPKSSSSTATHAASAPGTTGTAATPSGSLTSPNSASTSPKTTAVTSPGAEMKPATSRPKPADVQKSAPQADPSVQPQLSVPQSNSQPTADPNSPQ
jgi:rod shape-determining protein MreC